jgi:hypothetical protein
MRCSSAVVPLPRSVTRTVRLDEELDKAISKKASNGRTSVSFLVNRCIRKFVEWDSPSFELGVVSVPESLLDKLARDKDEEALEVFGREVASDFVKPATEYVLGEFTVESAIEILRRSSLYSGRYTFDFANGHDSRNSVIVLRHDHGRLWSRYYAGLLDETFKVLLREEVKATYTDSLCVVQLKVH